MATWDLNERNWPVQKQPLVAELAQLMLSRLGGSRAGLPGKILTHRHQIQIQTIQIHVQIQTMQIQIIQIQMGLQILIQTEIYKYMHSGAQLALTRCTEFRIMYFHYAQSCFTLNCTEL